MFFTPLFAIALAAVANASPVALDSNELPQKIWLIPIGTATWYTPSGDYGACGWTIQNSDMAVAIGLDHWDSGLHCGAIMTVTCELLPITVKQITNTWNSDGSRTIDVVVADLCPGCQGPNGIDLTQGAMAALDPNYFVHGVDNVTWSVSY
ncbi:hypothetical protein MSAN_01131000 [Mycena sanguinolenta]|uniref:RlpA-like protein double-psi beta-barrel domain-containing protein n=1 Tax=Mycena sanguinolenta TaxID=230812 RepID=A0A8H6YGW9_9AGAR|nr:hypothetical protein MSAN_01131000 [Mycena sanguinolenta]